MSETKEMADKIKDNPKRQAWNHALLFDGESLVDTWDANLNNPKTFKPKTQTLRTKDETMPLPAFKTLVDRSHRKMLRERKSLASREIKDCLGFPRCNVSAGGPDICDHCSEAEDIREARESIAYDEIKRLGYTISYNPPSIPQRSCDYQFAHDEYDGPGDPRCGCAPCPELALERIKRGTSNTQFETFTSISQLSWPSTAPPPGPTVLTLAVDNKLLGTVKD